MALLLDQICFEKHPSYFSGAHDCVTSGYTGITSDLLVQSHITHDMSRGVTRRRVMPGQPGLHNNLLGMGHDLKNHFS